jgi:hypothetical protein
LNISKILFQTNRHNSLTFILLAFFLLLSIFFAFSGSQSTFAAEIFSKDDKPFGLTYDDWIAKYWNLWIGKNTSEATPEPGGCLIVNNDNKSDPAVMLMETAVDDSPHQVCKITSMQGIFVPLWMAWCDTGSSKGYSDEQLTKCAREQQNLGNIKSNVKVDGQPIAKLDVKMSLIPGSGKLDYKINSLANVTEFATKGFNLTIPTDTQKANQVPGTWRAGSQGWLVFLKPLPPGNHTVFYNIRVTPTGPLTSPGTSTHFADITYVFHVTKR